MLGSKEIEKQIRDCIAEGGYAAVLRVVAMVAEEQVGDHPILDRVDWSPEHGWLNVTDKVMGAWVQKYPTVRIKSELSLAHQWLLDNPSRRKKYYQRFIESWLSRAQKSSRAYNGGFKSVEGGGF